GVYVLTSNSESDNSERSGVVAMHPEQTPIASSSQIAEGDDTNRTRLQLFQAVEQLKASQERVAQLEGQLKQAPAAGDLDKARKQGDELRAQLSQGAEQLNAAQERVAQLEAQQKQAPAVGDL